MSRCTMHHLSFTVPVALVAPDLPAVVADLFGIQGLDPLAIRQPKGRHGYREYYSIRDADGEFIAIFLDGHGNLQDTAHFNIHGRAWDTGQIDPAYVCRWVIGQHGWATEIHSALDDAESILPWTTIQEISLSPRWDHDITTTLCRPRRGRPGCPTQERNHYGTTVYFGDRKADTTVCFYDERPALRVEYRTRTRGGATEIVRRVAEGDDLGTLTAGILARVLRFHVPGSGRKDRRPVVSWWSDFLDSVEPVQLPRHRPAKYRAPWYVPPTRRDKVLRAVSRHLVGDATDAPVLDALQNVIDDAAAKRQIAAEWGNGNQPCNYLQQDSNDEQYQTVASHNLSGNLTHALPLSDFHDFCPEITF